MHLHGEQLGVVVDRTQRCLPADGSQRVHQPGKLTGVDHAPHRGRPISGRNTEHIGEGGVGDSLSQDFESLKNDVSHAHFVVQKRNARMFAPAKAATHAHMRS